MPNEELSYIWSPCEETPCIPNNKQDRDTLLVHDPHHLHCLSIAEIPKTAKQLRSFIGIYRQFQKCQQNTAFLLKELEEFLAKQASSGMHLEWTDNLIKHFQT